LAGFHIPATRVEAACASGALAVHLAVLSVASGLYDLVIAAGVEKMTDVESDVADDLLASSVDRKWEAMYGATLPSLFAQMARSHMQRYHTTAEQMAQVAVKNHANAVHNPCAQYQNVITRENVLSSPLVADPLHMLDCSSIADGAAAVVLCAAEKAREYTDSPVYVKASAQAGDTIALHDRRDITTMDATVSAVKKAYQMASVEPSQIDLAEVHDSYTIAEIIAIEDLGFCNKGEGGVFTEEGETEIGGRIPVNPSGGLKACGHPLGATGVRQVVEITQQLRGEAGKRQVPDAELGLTHNIGGTGATALVHILAR
jgi:acetyl-CoA C-acetyltransferase